MRIVFQKLKARRPEGVATSVRTIYEIDDFNGKI